MWRTIVTAALAATWVISAAAGQAETKVSPRDQLVITVWGPAGEHYSRQYPVAPDGTMDFPDLGKVKVVGLTPRQIELELTRRLKDGQFLLSPQVSVSLEQVQNQQVTVSGEVTSPGVIQYAGELTVFDAIVRAGQATPAASDEVLIIRADDGSGGAPSEPIVVDLKRLREGDLSGNVRLVDGDRVIVRAAQDFFIMGEVRAPGPYPVRAGLTVEQALALAGGITERGSTRRIEIRRPGVEDLMKGVKLDELVRPGDNIKVNRSIM